VKTIDHVLVTGAAGAIGAAVTRAIRASSPSTKFTLLDRDAAGMAALAKEVGAQTITADLRDVDALPALLEPLVLDGLVNCAGVMRVQSLPSWQWDAARDLMAIDLMAPLRLMDLVVQQIVARGGGGSIINVSSMAGKVPLKGCAYYGAAKAGLAMASEIAFADLAPHGIRVLTVYPGPVTSALEQGARDDYGGGGALWKVAPTGDPAELAQLIVAALAAGEPRVVYPRAYGFGFTAPNLSRWIALSYGPTPIR